MANICDFQMYVRGNHADIQKFYDAMCQKGTIYMGRGAEADIEFQNENKAIITGWCKWSVRSAMVTNAESMSAQPGQWYWGEGINANDLEFITLFEACKKWHLDMEVYSEESGCCFQEHFVVIDGELVCEECVEWNEYWIEDYETKEEAEADLKITITDEEWEIGSAAGYFTRGGFENWDFEI